MVSAEKKKVAFAKKLKVASAKKLKVASAKKVADAGLTPGAFELGGFSFASTFCASFYTQPIAFSSPTLPNGACILRFFRFLCLESCA